MRVIVGGAWLVLASGCADEPGFDRDDVSGFYESTEHVRTVSGCDGPAQPQASGRCTVAVGCGEAACSEGTPIEVASFVPCEDGEGLGLELGGLLQEGAHWLSKEFQASVCTERCIGGTTANCTDMCPRGSGSCTLTGRVATIAWVEPERIAIELIDLRHDLAVPSVDCTVELARASEPQMHCTATETVVAERFRIPD